MKRRPLPSLLSNRCDIFDSRVVQQMSFWPNQQESQQIPRRRQQQHFPRCQQQLHHHPLLRHPNVLSDCRRYFMSEMDYHHIADETLECIQDFIDTQLDTDDNDIEYEASISSGVLTIAFPPHGIWVINKQTPNQQIWWSSPLSGPKRFEYNADDEIWYCTKDPSQTLGQTFAHEMHIIYPFLDKTLELKV